MDIIPNVGVGSVRFGMSPVQVLAHFQEEQKYEDWMGGNRNNSLLYHGLIFGFDRCDAKGPLAHSRLVEFTIFSREDAWLWGQRIGDWSIGTVIEYLERNGISYEIQESGDVLALPYSMSLSFTEGGQIEYIEAWEKN